MSDLQSRLSGTRDDRPSSSSHEVEVVHLPSKGSAGSPSKSDLALNPALELPFDTGLLTVETLQLKIGDDIRHISRQELLGFFWTNGPDTLCMVCGEDFDDERGPPIRTFSIDVDDDLPEEENSMLALSKLVVHIHNRHLECAKADGAQIITVSHVWHQEVADAHISKRSTDEAVALAWFVPIRILGSASVKLKDKYPKAELWHDYLSVPQWNYAVQQNLLLWLPVLYKTSPLCLVHLNDITNSVLSTALDETASLDEVLECILQFFNSHWFRRLWVSLEYVSCTRACLMVESNKLIFMRQSLDSFTPIMDLFKDRDRYIHIKEGPGFYNKIKRKYPRLRSNVDSTRKVDPNGRVLGQGYSLVSRMECRTYRDRFIALTGLLGLGNYTENVYQIPSNVTAACHWVSMKCLERGDFTPLLLVHTGETDVPYARWLRGHEHMNRLSWTGGEINSLPENPNIINNGRVEPELECVGAIEETCCVSFGPQDLMRAFELVVTFLLKKPNAIFSAANLVNTLLRMYAVPPYISRRYPGIPNSFTEYCDNNPDFEDEIMAIIVVYLKLLPRTEPADRLNICQLLASKLHFDSKYTSNLSYHTRLSYAGSHADSKFYLDVIARVRCEGCGLPFVFRMGLYKAYEIGWVGQKVYRIPRLGCLGFPGNGMGLIMAGTVIRGRTTFATPACACSIRKRVLIE